MSDTRAARKAAKADAKLARNQAMDRDAEVQNHLTRTTTWLAHGVEPGTKFHRSFGINTFEGEIVLVIRGSIRCVHVPVADIASIEIGEGAARKDRQVFNTVMFGALGGLASKTYAHTVIVVTYADGAFIALDANGEDLVVRAKFRQHLGEFLR